MALISALTLGCQSGEPPPPRLVPVEGKVTLDGKPLEGASIGFLPPTGSAGGSDVGPDGSYKITTMGFEGLPAGEYTVQISYKMGTDGKPQSLGQQFSLVQPDSMIGAKELLPKKYSDFGASELRATIPPEGATNLNFDIKGPLAEPPPIAEKLPKADDKGEAKGEATEAKAPSTEADDKGDETKAPQDKPKAGPESEAKAKDEPKP